MLRIAIFLFAILNIISKINAQSTTFSRFYNIKNGNEFGQNIILKNESYFIHNAAIVDPGTGNSKKSTFFTIVDKNFNVTNPITFINESKGAEKRSLQMVDDTIYYFGFNEYVLPNYWNILKTNINGDSIELLTYNDFPDIRMAPVSIQIKDDFLYLGGRTLDFVTHREIAILKTDKNGAKIKEERFYDIADPQKVNYLSDFIKTCDGNFILAFTTILGGTTKQAFIIKFDENLDTIWSKEFNISNQIFNKPDLTPTQDSGVIFTWNVYLNDIRDQFPDGGFELGIHPPTIYIIDKNGSTEWADTMWTYRPAYNKAAPLKNIKKLITAKNGDIIGAGYYRDHQKKRDWAWLFRYNSSGKLLWEKIYEDKNFTSEDDYFLDIKEAENGDIVCVGEFWDIDGEWNNATYTWLLRVDSNGCFEPGCGVTDSIHLIQVTSDYVTSTNEVISEFSYDNGIIIYPNPALDYIKVVLPNDRKIHKWEVLDHEGEKIIAGNGENINKIDISTLKSGLYYLEVIDDKGRSVVGKFVVE